MKITAAVPPVEQAQATVKRRWPIGVELLPGGAHARVWAPKARRVDLVAEPDGRATALEGEGNGYFSAAVPGLEAGGLYRFRLDGKEMLYPDPTARFQPEGPHGPSQLVDPHRFAWTDQGWQGRAIRGQVIYEMHIGTFTPEGTWDAALMELPALAELGVTVLEVMPVSEFPGRFGWGYDGVNLFAPTRLYGDADAMRRFVDGAHGLGLAVILDVVYNHFGPDGNYLKCFAEDYFTDRYKNEWGEAINFDGPNSEPVREFFLTNAAFWIEEYHLDGLRLDATQSIHDGSEAQGKPHILTEISHAVRKAAGGRATILVGENEPQQASMVKPAEQGGCGLCAIWNDDLHHSAMVALTGRTEAYYTDYRGTPQEFVSAMKHGFLYQGQWYRWQGKRRGMPAFGMSRSAFVNFLQNHDQIANSARGLRLHALTTPGRLRAMTALILLGPGTPMLFQGQEFAASAPFLYFADHKPELADLVEKGRAEFLAQFPSIAEPSMRAGLAKPHAEESFTRCKLDHREREVNAPVRALHRDLLRLRREDAVFAAQRVGGLDGAVLGEEAFVLRFFGEEEGDDRLVLVNLGRDLTLRALADPLLAPPLNGAWTVLWSSEDPAYGGCGTAPVERPDGSWRLPGHAALVLGPAHDFPTKSDDAGGNTTPVIMVSQRSETDS
ncbi:maltooligosyltrehalose trehalohydrolase [Azospirillum lipoferum]|uniref:malto-oligosyltrehalose trehalohydrolase n=1 Tax=Azospirillum TaxID=191 RepID=UPI001FEA4A5F|nr:MULTISPECIES: malto-oligosyltrehalose trehalohydrolase [Azospirillum]MCP1608767.1 maltooligosyltrehalose trehalohydrolase [Azospirillum lipoferum]MDW5535917.1 malto-oligosyltrehalose trehalohydrolase [Azospirillum sp. NL1]